MVVEFQAQTFLAVIVGIGVLESLRRMINGLEDVRWRVVLKIVVPLAVISAGFYVFTGQLPYLFNLANSVQDRLAETVKSLQNAL